MHPHVQTLLDLQKLDLEVSSLTKDIDLLPAEEAKRKRRLDLLERAATEAQARLQQGEVDSRGLDSAAREADEQIKRLNERLNIVRNNAEYQATLFEIESIRKGRDTTQDEGLVLLEALDGMRVTATTTAAGFDEERQVFEGFLAEAADLRASRAGDITVARGRRDAAADGVPPEVLREYEGLYKTREHLAVCRVDNGFCQGCYNKITVNDTARLMGKSAVIRCGSCQRILFLGER